MSKELWIAQHERAVAEAMEADPSLSWDAAYESHGVALRADALYKEYFAVMADEAKDRKKYGG